jgi:UMP-CMP kinase
LSPLSNYYYLLFWKDRRLDAATAASGSSHPRFSKKDTTVVFILGGPGAGKGTQCEKLVKEFGFVHLSAGDLLRDERNNPGSQYGELIHNCIKEGKIVPMEITISLLENAMATEKKKGNHRFLVDGFPRMVDQGQKFEETVCESQFVLYFECPEVEMERRLLKRGESSGRVDDNIDSIRKRFKTFVEATMPVMDHYGKQKKVKTVSGN